MKIFIIIWCIFYLCLSTSTLNYTYNNIKRTIKINGLLWVVLDYYSIKKYHSKDIPMKFFTYKKEIL